MMPKHEAVTLTADEHLKFKAIVEYATDAGTRRKISDAFRQVSQPQGVHVTEAWQRAAQRMWRAC